jgi:hypothetical protein
MEIAYHFLSAFHRKGTSAHTGRTKNKLASEDPLTLVLSEA